MADEIGYQADVLPGWASITSAAHEKNPAMEWPKYLEVVDQMRNEDAQVSSVHRAVTLPIRSTDWLIDPAGADAEVVRHVAQNLGLRVKGQENEVQARTRGRFSWEEHLRLALLELVHGHSYFEQVYRIEGGRAHLAKLAWRPPRSIKNIEVAADGGLVAIEQYGKPGTRSLGPFTQGNVRIPVDRLVAYVHEREGGNWLGRSILRPAYKNWLLKDRILRAQALTVERNGLGIPDYEGAPVPEGVTGDKRDEWLQSEREAGLHLAKNLRGGETAGISRPSGSKMQLMGVTGKLPDTDAPIRYHDEQIARAVLAHFLNLGTETGSWALGSTFANFFTDSLNAVSRQIADVVQQHVIEDLVDLNWGTSAAAPRIVPAAIGSDQPATAEAVKTLIDCGAIKPDEKLEEHMRSRYSLPAAAAKLAASGVDPEAARSAVASSETAREQAEQAAVVAQKVYLAVPSVLTRSEARDLVRAAGAELNEDDDPEEGQDESIPAQPGGEAANADHGASAEPA